MRLTLRSQNSVCGRRCISELVCACVRFIVFGRGTRVPRHVVKNRLACVAHQPTREFPRAFVVMLYRLHTCIFIIIIHSQTCTQTRDISVGVIVCLCTVYNIIFIYLFGHSGCRCPDKNKRLADKATWRGGVSVGRSISATIERRHFILGEGPNKKLMEAIM